MSDIMIVARLFGGKERKRLDSSVAWVGSLGVAGSAAGGGFRTRRCMVLND